MKKVFIFAMQRSGASILSSVIGELPGCQHYPETNAEINGDELKDAGQAIRLKPFSEIDEVFKKIPLSKKYIVAKSIVESQNASLI